MNSRRQRLLIFLSFAAFVSLGLPDGVLGVAWPSIRHELSVPIDRLGLLLTSSMIGYLLATATSGEIVRRLGVGKLLLASTMLVVVSLAGYAAAPSWGVFVALGLFAGLGAGAIDAGINAFAAANFRPGVVSWLHACYGIGATIGPLTMASVIVSGLSWRVGYGLLAAGLALMGLFFLLTLRLWDAKPPTGASEAAHVSATHALRRPIVWLHLVIFFIYTGTEVTAGQWLFSVFTESRLMSVRVAGTCIGLYWGGLTAGRIIFGVLVERLTTVSMIRIGMFAAPLAAAVLIPHLNPIFTAAACATLGFALAPIYPMLISVTPVRLGAAYAAQAIGFQVAAAYLGSAALPTIAGILALRVGLEMVCPFIVTCCVVLLLLHEFAIWAAPASRSEMKASAPTDGTDASIPSTSQG
jgi:fucose permease